VVVAHALTVFAAAVITHGNISLPVLVERALQPLFITLDLHRIHHSIDAADANSNYGAVLSIWDRIFGTLRTHPATPHNDMVFGVQELSPQEGIAPVKMILTPWLIGKSRNALAKA
jgi:sterol desaturase/sphingolipid hydroxylase (fatty acid hydroxylase superfamily)